MGADMSSISNLNHDKSSSLCGYHGWAHISGSLKSVAIYVNYYYGIGNINLHL